MVTGIRMYIIEFVSTLRAKHVHSYGVRPHLRQLSLKESWARYAVAPNPKTTFSRAAISVSSDKFQPSPGVLLITPCNPICEAALSWIHPNGRYLLFLSFLNLVVFALFCYLDLYGIEVCLPYDPLTGCPGRDCCVPRGLWPYRRAQAQCFYVRICVGR